MDVYVTRIASIKHHPNADRLSIVEIGECGGYQSIVGRDQFAQNDLVIYLPTDALLPDSIIEHLKKVSKISISSNRLRAIKIRGIVSEGICLKPQDWLPEHLIKNGANVATFLNITKFEPDEKLSIINSVNSHKSSTANKVNENFKKYTHIDRIEKCPNILATGEDIVATMKFHGMNYRIGYIDTPKQTNWFMRLISKLFSNSNKCVEIGSHNTIIDSRRAKQNAKSYTHPFLQVTERYQLKQNIPNIALLVKEILELKEIPNVILFGELIGPQVQKGYDYGISKGQLELRFFDLMVNNEYVDFPIFIKICKAFNLPIADVVYIGPFNQDILNLCQAIDIFGGKQYNREGIVIKPIKERCDYRNGRVIFKKKNPIFLLDPNNTDFH